MTAPGDWRVWQALKASAQAARLGLELELELRDDRHSYTMVREFAAHAKGRSTVRLEYFYRALRQRHGVLLHDGAPLGGQWNVDADKREAFGAAGPSALLPPARYAPDAIIQQVIALVRARFAQHPGTLDHFA